jgi:predicted phage terminase large subunit-like protein
MGEELSVCIPQDAEIELIRDITKHSFFRFVQEFWGTIIVDKPIWNWHIKYLCDEVQIMLERVFKGLPKLYDLVINIPPSTTKSTIFSIFLPAYTWVRMPSARIIACSYSGGLAEDFSRKNLNVIQSELFQRCFPEIVLGLRQSTHFTNTKSGERYCAGIGGAITGKHAHCMPAGTLVTVFQDVKPIEQIQVGDNVLSQDIDGVLVYKKVVAIIKRECKNLYEIKAGGRKVRATSDHKFFVYGFGYKEAKDLQIGDDLVSFTEKQRARIESITRVSNETEFVYDIEVEGAHNFFANGFLVHNCIVIDDPINPMEAASEAGLRNASLWLHETITTRTVDATVTPIIMIMQRLHQNDPTGDWIDNSKEGSFKHICLPADCSEGQKVLPEEVKLNYVDGLLDPLRLSRDLLEQRRKWMGEYGYACQYDQQPIPRSGGMFLIDRLRVGHVDPSDPVTYAIRYWDKAISVKKTACFTVGAKLGVTRSGKFYVLDVIRGRWDSDARERLIRQTAERDGKSVVIGIEQEPGSGGFESAISTVRNLAGFVTKIDKADTHKETRAEPFSAQVNGYNVTLVPGEWNTDYIAELQYFPSSRYKDQVDASAGAFNLIATMRRRVASGW